MRLEFEGLDELIAEVERIEGMTEELKDQALIAGGELLLTNMIANVYSMGLNIRSGEARESLTRTDPVNGEIFVGTQGGKKAPGYYLYMHEFGYYNVRAKRFMAPKPFASITYENSKSEIMEAYADVFRKGWGMS